MHKVCSCKALKGRSWKYIRKDSYFPRDFEEYDSIVATSKIVPYINLTELSAIFQNLGHVNSSVF